MGKLYKIRLTYENEFNTDHYPDIALDDYDGWIEVAEDKGGYLKDWQIFNQGFENQTDKILKLAEHNG